MRNSALVPPAYRPPPVRRSSDRQRSTNFGGRWRRELIGVLSSLALACIAFVAGAAIYDVQVFPAEALRNAFIGGKAFVRVATHALNLVEPYRTKLYGMARSSGSGVTRYASGMTQPGLTLYTSGHSSAAFLIDPSGQIVHRWALPFSQAWPNPEHISFPVGDRYIYFRETYVYPDGGLLTNYEAPDTTPHSYGMIKIDKDSKLVWKYPGYVHHDFDVATDGTIFALVQRFVDRETEGRLRPVIEDGVAILSPDGKLAREIYLADAIDRSAYRGLLDRIDPMDETGDLFHANSIDILTAEMAPRFPFLRSGQLLVSLAAIDALVVLDPVAKTIVWAVTGPWLGQHDADFLPNGNMLLFDNKGAIGRGGRSQVLEFEPITTAIVWSYRGTAEDVLYSAIRSDQERLANGNTLITESTPGRIFEVTPLGEIVWEFYNPHRAGPGDAYIAVVSGVQRLDPARLPFLQGKSAAK